MSDVWHCRFRSPPIKLGVSWVMNPGFLPPFAGGCEVRLASGECLVWGRLIQGFGRLRFFRQTACIRASAHNPFGNWAAWSMAQTHSRSVRFSLLVTLFSWGVLCMMSLHSVPCLVRWVLNVPLRYSPPRSDHRVRILVLCWVRAQASNPR